MCLYIIQGFIMSQLMFKISFFLYKQARFQKNRLLKQNFTVKKKICKNMISFQRFQHSLAASFRML